MTGDEREARENAFVLVDVFSNNGTNMFPGDDGTEAHSIKRKRVTEVYCFVALDICAQMFVCTLANKVERATNLSDQWVLFLAVSPASVGWLCWFGSHHLQQLGFLLDGWSVPPLLSVSSGHRVQSTFHPFGYFSL